MFKSPHCYPVWGLCSSPPLLMLTFSCCTVGIKFWGTGQRQGLVTSSLPPLEGLTFAAV